MPAKTPSPVRRPRLETLSGPKAQKAEIRRICGDCAEDMLSLVSGDIRQRYYGPKLHGLIAGENGEGQAANRAIRIVPWSGVRDRGLLESLYDWAPEE